MSLISVPAGRYSSKQFRGTLLAFSFDVFTFALSVFLAFHLRFDGAVPGRYLGPMWVAVCIWAWAKSAVFIISTVNRGYWRYTSIHEVRRILLANSLGSILGGCIIVLFRTGIPHSVYILEWLVSSFLTLGSRLAVRMISTPKER